MNEKPGTETETPDPAPLHGEKIPGRIWASMILFAAAVTFGGGCFYNMLFR